MPLFPQPAVEPRDEERVAQAGVEDRGAGEEPVSVRLMEGEKADLVTDALEVFAQLCFGSLESILGEEGPAEGGFQLPASCLVSPACWLAKGRERREIARPLPE